MPEAAAQDRLNDPNRPFWWLVTYTLDPSFFTEYDAAGQYKLEAADGEHAVDEAIQRKWKAAYASTDFKQGWILLDLGNQSQQADAEEIMKGYPMYKYYAKTLQYTRVYSATAAGINLPIVLGGIKDFLKEHL